MIDLSEIEITLVRSKGGRRTMRLIHRPSGISVEDQVQRGDSIVSGRNKLLAELEKRVQAGVAAGTRRK